MNTSVSKEEEFEKGAYAIKVNIDRVKAEISTKEDDVGGSSPDRAAEPNCVQDTAKRKQIQNGSGKMTPEYESPIICKRRRIICEDRFANLNGIDAAVSSQGNSDDTSKVKEATADLLVENEDVPQDKPSYRKPLYSISHKISDRRNAQPVDQHTSVEVSDRVYLNSLLQQRNLTDTRKSYPSALPAHAADGDSTLYSLIHKMFFTLNTLNSTMTQLHSKIDLLSLEVNRIKKHVNPGESVVEFLPPAEYQLNNAELKQVLDQSSSPGDFACRLLVQLFPELFTEDEVSRGCNACGSTSEKKLDSLHLQLIRNYIEVCYPSARNSNIWQVECLPQVSDFFNRFWAQREMESSQQNTKVISFYEADHVVEQPQPNCYIDNNTQDEGLSLDSSSSMNSDLVLEPQEISEYLDEASSPGEFAILLVHRLFPELSDLRCLASQTSCYGSSVKQALDPQRLQIIRKYVEIYFPDVQDDKVWLQQVIHKMDEELASMNSDGSESDVFRNESHCSPNVSMATSNDSCDFDKSTQKSKKIWLMPVDFKSLVVPPPDFEVPCPDYILSKQQLKNIYESSLSIGNFASRLLVRLFPELFTPENLRKQYNCSGSLGKKQLDPVRIKLIRHYVQLMYPRAKCDKAWNQEFVSKLDERCRRRDTEQRRVYQQQRKKTIVSTEKEEPTTSVQPEPVKMEAVLLAPERTDRYHRNFCKVALDELTVPTLDFPVPNKHLLSTKELKEIVQDSLSIGNFAARLLVRIFPELFTSENLRLQYNHSGACNKKQLDPVRLRLIRHYVEAVYPRARNDQVWHLECIPSIDERCRRPDRRKSKVLGKPKDEKNETFS
ncbi:BEN domain-containing protein 3 [Carcharodon carcharias]|uniref:BEN domain-containing protein 3 n=1 Tax=Carcharodon carcharias TaxID=13397 RepID=UPI001B7EA412|nr:BEN domain-containing protein 3 [Carcharodon carcharias]XP_041043422.1 BEN domain-containing protein 3 [Carcharodon carcharias]XP_041043423.1 BEN domain-containing protein 3 [Carcharodon carcharias]XP_041043424.1 BEN domain-containing protein 3 [Carcharodon carcharias]